VAAALALAGEIGAGVLKGVLGEDGCCDMGVTAMGTLPKGVGTPLRDASPMAGDMEMPVVLNNFFGIPPGPVVGDLCDASAICRPCRRFVGDVASAEAMKERSGAPLGVL